MSHCCWPPKRAQNASKTRPRCLQNASKHAKRSFTPSYVDGWLIFVLQGTVLALARQDAPTEIQRRSHTSKMCHFVGWFDVTHSTHHRMFMVGSCWNHKGLSRHLRLISYTTQDAPMVIQRRSHTWKMCHFVCWCQVKHFTCHLTLMVSSYWFHKGPSWHLTLIF